MLRCTGERGDVSPSPTKANARMSPPGSHTPSTSAVSVTSAAGGNGKGRAGDAKKSSTFQAFMEQLQQAKDLKKHVLSRIASITSSAASPDAACTHTQSEGGGAAVGGRERSTVQEQAIVLVQDLYERVREHPFWQGASPDELDTAFEAIEKLVTLKLHHLLFGACAHEQALDTRLQHRIACLQFLEAKHLDIDEEIVQRASFQSCLEVARQELCNMNNYKSPKDKVVCIYNCCKVASRVLTLTSENSQKRSTGADELLPLLILLLLQANPSALHSNLSFISNCRHPSKLTGEQGYYLTNIMSAAEFLLTVCDERGVLMHEDALSMDGALFTSQVLSWGFGFRV